MISKVLISMLEKRNFAIKVKNADQVKDQQATSKFCQEVLER